MNVDIHKLEFKDFENLSWSIIHRIAKKYNGPENYSFVSNHLFSLSFEIFIESKKSFNDSKETKFSSWFYSQLNYKLMNEINRGLRTSVVTSYEDESVLDYNDFSNKQSINNVQINEMEEHIMNELFNFVDMKWDDKERDYMFWSYAFDETLGDYNSHLNKDVFNNINKFLKYPFFIDCLLEDNDFNKCIVFDFEKYKIHIDQLKLNKIINSNIELKRKFFLIIHSFLYKFFYNEFKMKNKVIKKIQYILKILRGHIYE